MGISHFPFNFRPGYQCSESITTTSIAPLLTRAAISSACSPVSAGKSRDFQCLLKVLGISGVKACSASTNAAIPPRFGSSAMMEGSCSLSRRFGPKISIALPLGIPPTPSAISRVSAPVGLLQRPFCAEASPSFIMEPLPNCFQFAREPFQGLLFSDTVIPPQEQMFAFIMGKISRLSTKLLQILREMRQNTSHVFHLAVKHFYYRGRYYLFRKSYLQNIWHLWGRMLSIREMP